MSWIAPLGFLGLLSLGVWLLIYLLKPNYQQKVISSTYVWKLSLKYRKRRIPMSKLRNILLIICQILILVSCALMLAQPVIKADKNNFGDEKVVIIDASASMRTVQGNETRFERAVAQVKSLANDVSKTEDGKITVILAGKEAEVLVSRADTTMISSVYDTLDELVKPDTFACTYGKADIDGAITLAEEVLKVNGEAEVLLYTGTKYLHKGAVTVKDVSDDGEFNVAILNCQATLVDNFYTFTIDIACYGRDQQVTLVLDVYGVNQGNGQAQFRRTVTCSNDTTQQIVFNTSDEVDRVYLFEHAEAKVDIDDSFSNDNTFYLYDGQKQPLKIQYYSTKSNIFNDEALLVIRDELSYRWDISFKVTGKSGDAPEMNGYDFYIFEHTMPSVLPGDGVVLLVNPDKNVPGLDMVINDRGKLSGEFSFTRTRQHPITNGLYVDEIESKQYAQILSYDGYENLITSNNDDPILLVKNDPDVKVAVFALDLNYSTFGVQLYSILLYNLLEFYLPSTLTEYVYEIDQTVSLNARGTELTVTNSGNSYREVLVDFPSTINLSLPGVYTLEQTKLSQEQVIENFYVRIAASESYINRVDESDVLRRMELSAPPVIRDTDLIMYFAIALVVLLLAEWLLQSREGM